MGFAFHRIERHLSRGNVASGKRDAKGVPIDSMIFIGFTLYIGMIVSLVYNLMRHLSSKHF